MSHAITVTRGLVLSKRGLGEANVLLALLTLEHGLIKASARSARKDISKLRYGLEPFTAARFSLVRGRFEWKLVGAEDISYNSTIAPKVRSSMGRVARLLLRLVHGEERSPALYETFARGLEALHVTGEHELEHLECVLVLRLLSLLGYVPQTAELAPFIESEAFSPELLTQAAAKRALLIRSINDALRVTGL